MISVHTDDPEKLRAEFMKNADEWHGEHVDRISLSVGYASYRANSGSSVVDLERIADADMYKEKERYYRESGLDRRRRNA